jgi:hypothetical protein
MTYEILIAVGIIAAVLITFLVYWSKAHTLIKMSTLVGLLMLGMLAMAFYDDMLGAPLPFHPGDKFFLVHYIITPDSQIYIWAFTQDDEKHRLHVIPYDRETAGKLEESQRRGHEGRPVFLEFTPREGGRPGIIIIPMTAPGTAPTKDTGSTMTP